MFFFQASEIVLWKKVIRLPFKRLEMYWITVGRKYQGEQSVIVALGPGTKCECFGCIPSWARRLPQPLSTRTEQPLSNPWNNTLFSMVPNGAAWSTVAKWFSWCCYRLCWFGFYFQSNGEHDEGHISPIRWILPLSPGTSWWVVCLAACQRSIPGENLLCLEACSK